MKSRLYIAISLLAAFFSIDAMACGPFYYEPQDYYLYRVSPRYLSGGYGNYYFHDNIQANSHLWWEETGMMASLADVHSLVYEASLPDLLELRDKGKRSELYKTNSFARLLMGQKDAMDFMVLAKQCEVTRKEMADPWYYPAKKDPQRLMLEEIAENSVKKTGTSELGRRYALQATRALLTLGRYQECIDFWEHQPEWNGSECIHTMCVRNVAGAYYHLGNKAKANELYCSIGDIESLITSTGKSWKETLLAAYKYNPDDPVLRDIIENNIGEELYDVCLKIAREGKVKDPNFWYYNAAYVEYTQGRMRKALATAKLAESSAGTEYIRESARVLRICIEAETLPYSSSYETTILNHVKWLDGKIIEHLDEAVEKTKIYGIERMAINESFYYFNDMLRKVLLGTVCSKLIRNHREVSALAFANMADNRLLSLVDSVAVYEYDEDYNSNIRIIPMKTYRDGRKYDKNDFYNGHDYSDAFFNMMDTLDVQNVIQYVKSVDSPRTEQQKYLNARSYTDRDYLNDIVGTRLLRIGQYGDAEKWLAKVSPDYQYRLNTAVYMDHDPFSFKRDSLTNNANYKYNFAKEMARLCRVVVSNDDHDAGALAAAKLAIGMRNSVDHCWPLAFYHKFAKDYDEDADTPYSRARELMLDHIEDTYTHAYLRTRNPETAAKVQLMFGNYKSVMSSYRETEAARSIAGRCDNYYDYHLDHHSSFDQWWIDYGPNHKKL